MYSSTSSTAKTSCFDGLQKNFWEIGDKSINKDQVYELLKLKKNKTKKQNYSIDLKRFLIKKVTLSNSNYMITKSFNLIITSYKVITMECTKILTNIDNLYGWEFYRCQKTFLLFTTDKTIHENLNQIFIGLCILNDFHEKFDCVKKIGGNSFGQVFQAKKKHSDIQYAVKGYTKKYLTLEIKQLKGLQNEIFIMRQLDTPSILKLEEVYETKNSIYLIFQFHSGGHLLDRFQQKTNNSPRLSQKIVNQIMKNLVQAICYLQSKDIMHRNLCPDNIIFRNLSDHTDVVISEFGFADSASNPKMIFKRCGTAGYFAPEVLSYRVGDVAYNEKCDVFSLGSIFYVLLTGQNPFESEQQEIMIQKNKECVIDFDHPALRNRPGATLELLRQMLTVNPNERISIEAVSNHNYFKIGHKESTFLNTAQFSYSKLSEGHSYSLRITSSEQYSNNQLLTMQRLPFGSQLNAESSPYLLSSTNEINLKDKNYLGYDTYQRQDCDSEKNSSQNLSFDLSPKTNKVNKKSRFSKSSIIANLERTISNELQDFSDVHELAEMMNELNRSHSYDLKDINLDINNNDYHSVRNIKHMNFSILCQNVKSVESRSHEIQKSKSNSRSPLKDTFL